MNEDVNFKEVILLLRDHLVYETLEIRAELLAMRELYFGRVAQAAEDQSEFEASFEEARTRHLKSILEHVVAQEPDFAERISCRVPENISINSAGGRGEN